MKRTVELLRLRPAFIFLTALALILMGGIPAKAADPLTASISGTVQIAPNVGVSQAYVHVVEADASRWNYGVVTVVAADPSGAFRVEGLAAGRYKLAFSEFDSSAEGQWYNNSESFGAATVVALAAGQNLTGVTATVIKRGTIGGKIAFPSGVDPSGVMVTAYNSSFAEPDELSAVSDYVAADGTYKIRGLSAGTYRIKFTGYSSGLLDAWHSNAESFSTAKDITVARGQDIVGINTTLVKGATISGKITAPAGVDLSRSSIDAYRSDYSGTTAASASVADDGTYKIIGLPPGTYRLHTSGGYGSGAVEQWHNNAESFNTATDITVTLGQDVTGINATLVKGATIAGKLTAPAGVNLTWAAVQAYQSTYSSSPVATTYVAEDGTYKFVGLRAGSYKLKLSDESSGALELWHGNAGTFAAATPVTVTTGQDVAGINATLVKGATISGTVTAPPGVDLKWSEVAVYSASYVFDPARTAYIQDDGTYKVIGLPAGSYKIQFSGYRGANGALEQWHDNATSFDAATTVTLSTGQDLTNTDATLVKGASISGKVTLPPGVQANAGVTVSATTGKTVSASVNPDGTYRAAGLPAGTYTVRFNGYNSGVLDQWYNAATEEDAQPISLAEGQDVTGIDATLIKSASISGKVTAPVGVDLSASRVTVHGLNSEFSILGSAELRPDGTYKVGGLRAGSYKVQFSGTNNGAFGQWYNNAAAFSSAAPVTLGEGQDLAGVNAALVKSASISGKVTAPAGVDLASTSIYVEKVDGSSAGDASIGPDGSYKVTGLAAGSYKVQFYGSDNGALEQWYNNASTRAAAQPVVLTQGQDAAGVNATLIKAATISGKIAGPAGINLSGVSVYAVKADGTRNYYGMVQRDGTYTISQLPAGAYKIQFSGYGTGALTQWYSNAATLETAASVTVAAAQDLTGIDATLVKGATISGKVTVGAGAAPGGYARAHKVGDASFSSEYSPIGADGTYKVIGLPAGTYKLEFGVPGALNGWHSNATSIDTATPVTVAASQDRTGINADLVKGASISGKVTAPEGIDVTTGRVSLYRADSGTRAVGTSSVTADGSYSVIGLPPGSYKLKFEQYSNGALDQWFNNASSFGTATAVTVSTSQSVTGINASLIKGASISGTVFAPAGVSIGSSYVSVFRADDSSAPVREGTVNPDGTYKVVGIPTGNYKIQLNGNTSGVTDQWFGGGATFAAATPLALAAGTDKPAVNFSSQIGGKISGTVSGPDRNSYPVSVLDLSGKVIRNSYSQPDGTFDVVGLAAGSYKVAFNRSSGYATEEAQFYQGKPESSGLGLATSVAVQTGQAATNVNAVLTAGGTVSGTVTDKAGDALPWAMVQAYTADGSLVTRTAWADAAGKYSVGGLTTGKYLVKVTSGKTELGNLWSGNAITEAAAIPVSVTKGQSVTTDLSYAKAASALTAPVPTVSGVAKVGSTLAATAGTWGPAPVTLKYQWKAGGVDIAGATASTYKPGAAQVGKTLTVTVTGTKTGYAAASKTSVPTGTVMALNPVLTAPTPKISGLVKVGSTLTATAGTWGPAPVTLKYQWKAAGVAITGATASTYKPVAANLGKNLTVTVTGSKAGYTTASKTSAATVAVGAGVLTAPVPKVTGTVRVGSTLTATAGTWGPAPVTLKYQWKAAGVAIAGATASTYKPVAANLGKALTVTVTGSKAGYTTASKTSAATVAVGAGVLTAPVPKVTGTVKVGSTLTATAGAWGPAPVTLKYQWKAAGVAIAGATASTYKPVAANLGKALTVTVTGSKAGYTTASKTSVATVAVAAGTLTAPVPTVTGVVKVGSTLTAAAGAWGPSPVTLRYQWKAAGVSIVGATASTYKPAAAQAGKTLTVTVTGSRTGYTTAVRTSTATVAVAR